MGDLTEHFSLSEYRSKFDDKPVPNSLIKNAKRCADDLEILRAELGAIYNREVYIKITSGYRSKENNDRLVKDGKAVKNSWHRKALANDIRCYYLKPETKYIPTKKVFGVLKRLIKDGIMQPGGLGLYKTFVHRDLRGRNARWQSI